MKTAALGECSQMCWWLALDVVKNVNPCLSFAPEWVYFPQTLELPATFRRGGNPSSANSLTAVSQRPVPWTHVPKKVSALPSPVSITSTNSGFPCFVLFFFVLFCFLKLSGRVVKTLCSGGSRVSRFLALQGATERDGLSAALPAMPPPPPPRAETLTAFCQQAEDKNLVSCLDLFLLECFADAPLFLHAFANLFVSPILRHFPHPPLSSRVLRLIKTIPTSVSAPRLLTPHFFPTCLCKSRLSYVNVNVFTSIFKQLLQHARQASLCLLALCFSSGFCATKQAGVVLPWQNFFFFFLPRCF